MNRSFGVGAAVVVLLAAFIVYSSAYVVDMKSQALVLQFGDPRGERPRLLRRRRGDARGTHRSASPEASARALVGSASASLARTRSARICDIGTLPPRSAAAGCSVGIRTPSR